MTFRKDHLSRVVWRLSLPIIFIEATETFDHVISTMFLARVGVTELGAIAVADTVLMLFLILPLALVDGIQILTARRVGQRRTEGVGVAFNQGLLLVLMFSLVSTAALKLFSQVVATWFVESAVVGQAVDAYLQIEAYGICLIGVTFACSALLISLGKTRAIVPATIILVVSDVLLNYVFIFGKLGFPALGMRGAALASVGAELVTAIFLTAYVWREFRGRHYGFFRFGRFDGRTVRVVGRLAAPVAGLRFVEDLRWFVFFLIIERVGASALAVANVVYTCYLLFSIPAEGFSETACSMVSRYIGRNRTNRISEVLRSTTGGAILVTGPFIVFALCLPRSLLAAFAPSADLLDQSDACLRVVALAMLVAIPARMCSTAVEGTGDTTAAFGIELVVMVAMLALTWFAAIHFAWPLAQVWLSAPISWLLCLTLSYGWIKSGIWKRLEV